MALQFVWNESGGFNMALDLIIDINTEGDITIFNIKGELDDFHSPKLHDAFAQAIDHNECKKIIVDLDSATFIDSVGLGTIAVAGKKLMRQDGSIHLVCSKTQIIKLINASGMIDAMGTHFGLFENIEQAKERLQ